MISNELRRSLKLNIEFYKSIREDLPNLLDSSKKEIFNILLILEKLNNEDSEINYDEVLKKILDYLRDYFHKIHDLYRSKLESNYKNINNLLINLHKIIETILEDFEKSVTKKIYDDSFYDLAENLLEESEIRIVYPAVKKYLDEILTKKDEFNLNDQDIINFYELFINKVNDFYFDYLYDLEKFEEMSLESKINILYKYLKNELPDWIYDLTEYKGENESSDEENIKTKNSEPYDVSKIDIINQPFEVQSLYKKYKREPKELELSPDYQRNFVWNGKEKSRLIESIIIKIPLPLFYIDSRDEDKWIVIDGLQRLTTIFDFMDDKFKLTNMEYLDGLKGKKFSTLERKYQRRIEDFSLLCNLIRPNTPPKIAFNIFQRINTLGKKLEVQELRNAMYIGKSTQLLNELIKTKEFKDITSNKRNFKRMDDQAIILRYLSFKIFPYENYNKNDMNEFLENTMEKINSMSEIEIRSLKNTFIDCMKKSKILFDKNYFAKPSKGKDTSNPISKTLFESIGYSLDKYTINDIENNKLELRKKIYELYENEEFILKTSVATNNPPQVNYRFSKFQELFREVIGY
ncbi:DUF262 domain-containing protein [Aliarcobacter vitoriensis]|uniref:GmrSD restriction endonucleases N-terminal domain-containing protein n=1 Tax=Aliarcobacter vitoriensis TaxID=2011099 RepID=A0A366MTB8_9BACT|nr:DUF262 domain-containing protein [Aliarcobacter vitoriensis]RBQ29297.1 hypothetical protein CRU91_04230 [Aliarcobacter vitoriensis]